MTSTPSVLKLLAVLGGLLVACCCALAVYGGALYIAVDRDFSILPTVPLDPACADAQCLSMCIRRLPNFESQQLSYADRIALAERTQGYELARYRLNPVTGDLDEVTLRTVPAYLKPLQADRQLHLRIWRFFTTLYPTTERVYTSYMVVYANGAPERFSARIQELDGKWRLHVNLLDFDSPADVLEILTHEYAHLLTLNADQVHDLQNTYGSKIEQAEFEELRSQCGGNFFTGFGCARTDSYLNAFGKRFWSGALYDQWVEALLLAYDDHDAYQEALDQLYSDHADEFVSTYAATNPREDIAEAWTEFILRPKPTEDTVAAQKVQFFYEYPELVQARQHIIQGICQSAIDQK
jgi:hypothetical protein